MNRTRATFFLLVTAVASLGASGCHRHRVARGVYPAAPPPPVMACESAAPAPAPFMIIVETRGQGAPEVNYEAQEAAEQDAAAARAAAQQARRSHRRAERARIAHERAERERIARERAAQEQAEREAQAREAQARAAAQGKTTIIVLRAGSRPVVVDGHVNGRISGQAGVWFESQ